LPLVAIGELVAAQIQRRAVPTDDDWRAAAAAAKSEKRPGDVVIVAPHWAGPLGRKAIGEVDPSLTDLATVARSDLETAGRVLELSIRGKTDPQARGFRLASERRFGRVSLRVLENPKPERLVRDLADEIGPDLVVERVAPNGTREACRWEDAGPEMPSLFGGPSTPASRWICPPGDPVWSFVGTTVITDLNYRPRRCIFMHPSLANATVTFPPRKIGAKVVGYVGLHAFVEREGGRAPVAVRISVDGRAVAETRHVDGDGWLRFEGSTAEFAGTDRPVTIEAWAEGNPQLRVACVAAQLRE
jgi:hypothetical protein